jgi:hypothetical protein
MLIVVEVYADASENMVADVNKKKKKSSPSVVTFFNDRTCSPWVVIR